MMEGQAGEADFKAHLLEGLGKQGHAGAEAGGIHHRTAGPARPGSECLLQPLEQIVPYKMPGEHHQYPFGRVGPIHIPPQGRGGDGGDRIGPPADRPAHGRGRPYGSAECLVGQVFPHILIHGDLIEDHAPLHPEIIGVETGMEQHIEQDVQHPPRLGRTGIGGEDLRVKPGVLPGRVGVETAAERVDFLGNTPGSPFFGPFEQHMFGKMGDALFGGILIQGPRFYPDIHRGGQRVLLGKEQDTQAVFPFEFFHCSVYAFLSRPR